MRITLKNHLKALSYYLLLTGIIIIFLFFMNFDEGSLVVFGLYWGIMLSVPTFFLHTIYYLHNKNECINIYPTEIIVSNGSLEKKIKKEEIQGIYIIKSATLDKGGIPILPLESYFYVKIITRNGEKLIITCLISWEIDLLVQQIADVFIERRKVWFCFPGWPKPKN